MSNPFALLEINRLILFQSINGCSIERYRLCVTPCCVFFLLRLPELSQEQSEHEYWDQSIPFARTLRPQPDVCEFRV